MPIILPTTYLGNIQFFSKFVSGDPIIIEQHDHYQKQTYRNRCTILAANGNLNLTIPIIKNRNTKTPVKDIKIDYDTNWQTVHWKSILSAYNKSPFLEYYIDDFIPFYEKRWKFLIDYNTELMERVLENLEIETNFTLSENFIPINEISPDFRQIISPKNKQLTDVDFSPKEYTQAFSAKFNFHSNLSIIDLLFNCGPESISILT